MDYCRTACNVGFKTPADSTVEHVQILTQSDINGSGRLFGGRLMEWIDLTAAAVARRHSNRNVTTALVDRLDFVAPAKANDMVVLLGRIAYAGTSSMEVIVDSYVEELDGTRNLINEAHLVLVALDDDGKPCKVPELRPQTDAEKADWESASRRADERKRARMSTRESR